MEQQHCLGSAVNALHSHWSATLLSLCWPPALRVSSEGLKLSTLHQPDGGTGWIKQNTLVHHRKQKKGSFERVLCLVGGSGGGFIFCKTKLLQGRDWFHAFVTGRRWFLKDLARAWIWKSTLHSWNVFARFASHIGQIRRGIYVEAWGQRNVKRRESPREEELLNRPCMAAVVQWQGPVPALWSMINLVTSSAHVIPLL